MLSAIKFSDGDDDGDGDGDDDDDDDDDHHDKQQENLSWEMQAIREIHFVNEITHLKVGIFFRWDSSTSTFSSDSVGWSVTH